MIANSQVKTIVDKENLVLLTEVKSVQQLQIDTIEFIVADNIFTKIFFNDKNSIQVRRSLKEWENILPQKAFVRVNRGAIVNLHHVKLIEKSLNQTMIIYIRHYDKPVIMNRSYLTKLKGKLII